MTKAISGNIIYVKSYQQGRNCKKNKNLAILKTLYNGKSKQKRRSLMKISSKTHYGVQILSYLAVCESPVSAKELEKCTGVSSKYLEKVLKILSDSQIVTATRGANGGYCLTRPANEIRMGEAVRALEEDNMEIIDCVAKTGCCCPSSALWKKLFDGINEILDGVTLKDISEGKVTK